MNKTTTVLNMNDLHVLLYLYNINNAGIEKNHAYSMLNTRILIDNWILLGLLHMSFELELFKQVLF